ncbi:hypothetical protein VTL71DRAFT_11229 [Oculimacula yallundae]|uniref:C2H2-type domain-containing protein n=1 Tax=Oculimacula yallundae TaxID=86028 RepID=A0ABR4CVV3_9HELO
MSEYNLANQFLGEDKQHAFSRPLSPNVGFEGDGLRLWQPLGWHKSILRSTPELPFQRRSIEFATSEDYPSNHVAYAQGLSSLASDYLSSVPNGLANLIPATYGFVDAGQPLESETWPLGLITADTDNDTSTATGPLSPSLFPDEHLEPVVGYSSQGFQQMSMYGAPFLAYDGDIGLVIDDYGSQGLQDMNVNGVNFCGSFEPFEGILSEQVSFTLQELGPAGLISGNIVPFNTILPVQVLQIICTQAHCNETFTRDSDRIRHESGVHGINRLLHLCQVPGCVKGHGAGYTRKDKLTEHMWKKHAALGYVKRS